MFSKMAADIFILSYVEAITKYDNILECVNCKLFLFDKILKLGIIYLSCIKHVVTSIRPTLFTLTE